MTEPPNLFPEFMQADVRTCPRYPGTHPAYIACGDDLRDMPCPRCRGLRVDLRHNLSEEELKEVMKTAPKEPGFMPGFGKQEGVAKWS